MLAHLWLGQPAPQEFVEYRLCERFKCLPPQLSEVSYEDVLSLLACMAAEAQVNQKRAEMNGKKY